MATGLFGAIVLGIGVLVTVISMYPYIRHPLTGRVEQPCEIAVTSRLIFFERWGFFSGMMLPLLSAGVLLGGASFLGGLIEDSSL